MKLSQFIKLRSKLHVKYFIYGFIFTNVLIMYSLHLELNEKSAKFQSNRIRREIKNIRQWTRTDKKIILFWTQFFESPFDLSALDKCPELNCLLSHDKSLVNFSAALLFHPWDMFNNTVPEHRYQHQRYVLYLLESPPNIDLSDDLSIYSGFFNWTMTYRRDSDIFAPYGYFIQKPTVRQTDTLNVSKILGKNKKLLTWFVSNCETPSKREDYVNILQNYIPVDIYGSCGNFTCVDGPRTDCNEIIDKNYKFYIAFENSVCVDYITEKYYNRAYLNSIPIVLKRKIVEDILPRNSFIAVDDFSHPIHLAEYLKRLAKDDKMYLEYFQWKAEGYTLKHDHPGHYENFCQLCQKLWNLSEPSKFYTDINFWWNHSMCEANFSLRFIGPKDRKQLRTSRSVYYIA